MTATPQNHGKATIRVSTGSSGALETVGYTRNGADLTTEGFWIDVPGDENAGDSGPPIEIQYVSEMARVRIELTKFDQAVIDKIMRKLNTNAKTAGTLAVAGTFVFMNNHHFRLVIDTPTEPRNFYISVPRAPTQRNMGVRFAMKVLEFDCYANSNGVLWDKTVS